MSHAEHLANCAAGNHRFDTRRYVDYVEKLEFVGLKIIRVDVHWCMDCGAIKVDDGPVTLPDWWQHRELQ